MIVLDASAILALLREEPGHDLVDQAMESDTAHCGAANWSEVVQKILARGDNWSAMQQVLESYDLVIEPVTRLDAEKAAALWVDRPSLSLGDRLCLALAHRLGAVAMTADAAWGTGSDIQQIR